MYIVENQRKILKNICKFIEICLHNSKIMRTFVMQSGRRPAAKEKSETLERE